jgi:putative tryptophan/tyrosine transport system substrate-binding protein
VLGIFRHAPASENHHKRGRSGSSTAAQRRVPKGSGASSRRPAVLPTQAARHLGVAAVSVEGSKDIEDTFQQIVEEHIDAVDMLMSSQFFHIRSKIAELGLKYRLPIIGGEDGFAQFGGLINYGPSLIGNWRQAAVYVDKILKGEKPADLPISQPTKFELAINLKTAKALGLTVSPNLLALASEVIE